MRVLLSVKPKFADKIFDGSKEYEYRRVIFKNKNIKTVVVYASSPVKKVIGEFDIAEIINKNITLLWNETKDKSGITESFFLDYFKNKKDGYALRIKDFKKYQEPISISRFRVAPPQSFVYIDDD